MTRPQLFVLAGPNGSGKSTIARKHIIGRIPFVNADDIAQQLAPETASTAAGHIGAGRLAIKERQRLLSSGASFAFETTLSGASELHVMEQAAAQGYKVNLVYVGLRDPAVAAARVDLRTASGGHDVAKGDIFRRYERSIAALPKALTIAHRAWVFDNSGERRQLLCTRDEGRTKFLSKSLPAWAETALPSEIRTVSRSRRI